MILFSYLKHINRSCAALKDGLSLYKNSNKVINILIGFDLILYTPVILDDQLVIIIKSKEHQNEHY